ncbi:sulfotransferase [Plantactinospora sp. S1510]|uniref:Sulfotransferase n=1 Tax=Plantactinospora alkalitolerans TaxID=2789879 RepID=A0ABS0GVT3_9ACTN|nr:sulfotransferase [Plantactinospora alkalitolerans]MBF9130300.1 sulfotransferase [Plantactinospora alkalitolerans]
MSARNERAIPAAANEVEEGMAAEPIFVLGSPRSGTTLAGAWLGSHPSVYAMGEYSAFVFAYATAPAGYTRTRPPYAQRYLRELQSHAAEFAGRLAAERGARFFCDSTPWNLLVADTLAELYPSARFVLTLRHYSGVIQSLERSYLRRYLWAGATPVERASIWVAVYERAAALPADRTTVFSYDELCADPGGTVARWRSALARVGVDPAGLDDRVFLRSHASGSDDHRRTVATGTGGRVRFAPIPSIDPLRWSETLDTEVRPVVGEVDRMLRQRFAEYATPPYAMS